MNNGEYWRKRSEIREARAYSNCLEATNGLVNAYRDTAANIRREINDFYNRFATENGMDYADAVKLLNREEALEWRTSVEGYIEEIRREKDPAVRERLMQEYDARAYGSRITRLESLNGSIDTELSKLYARANEQFQQLLGENYTDGYYQAIYDIQSRYGYSSAFATVNSKVVENALTYPWSGANFSDRLWKHKFELLNQLRETLTTGLIRGESVQDMSKRLAERMNVSRSNALRLIRTESSHIHNVAELDAYKACGFEEYEYMASFGERTCDACGGLDGQRFKLSEKQPGVNFPPLHPNCRCTTIAVDPDDDLEDIKSGELDYEQWYQKYVGGRASEKLGYREGTETAVPRGQPVPVMSGGAQNSAGQLLTTRGKSDIISREDIFVHPDKINKFCLDPKGKHADEFFSVGYKPGDYEILYQDLMRNFDESKIVDKVNPGDGVERFSVFMDLGVDKKKRFRTVWQKDTPDSKPRFITAHRED